MSLSTKQRAWHERGPAYFCDKHHITLYVPGDTCGMCTEDHNRALIDHLRAALDAERRLAADLQARGEALARALEELAWRDTAIDPDWTSDIHKAREALAAFREFKREP